MSGREQIVEILVKDAVVDLDRVPVRAHDHRQRGREGVVADIHSRNGRIKVIIRQHRRRPVQTSSDSKLINPRLRIIVVVAPRIVSKVHSCRE